MDESGDTESCCFLRNEPLMTHDAIVNGSYAFISAHESFEPQQNFLHDGFNGLLPATLDLTLHCSPTEHVVLSHLR